MQFKLDNRVPVYVQVIRHFKEQIASGTLEKGDVIPSRRELAKEWKINPNTAQRAYREMERLKLIYTEGTQPSRITEDEQIIKQVRKSIVQEAVDQLIDISTSLHIPLEDILSFVEERFGTRTNRGDEND